jgi:hypothetical protein
LPKEWQSFKIKNQPIMNNLPMIASRVEENIQNVQLVIDNRELRIFKTGTKEAMPKVTEVLSQLLPVYGIEAKPEHLMEMTEFVLTYKLLAVDEIKLAFEKFAKQELDINDHKLYGKVDLYAIGRILTAYINWRQKIYFAMDSDLQAKKEEEDRIKRLGKVAEEYDKDFDNKLKNFQKPLEEIPVFWYDECVKRGYINDWKEGEKEALWAEAQEMAKQEKPDSDNMIDRKNHMRKIEEGNMPRARALAYKLAVWRKVLLR